MCVMCRTLCVTVLARALVCSGESQIPSSYVDDSQHIPKKRVEVAPVVETPSSSLVAQVEERPLAANKVQKAVSAKNNKDADNVKAT
jgi:hypothetical protein